MLILYVKDNCRYSRRVLDVIAHVTEPVEIRNRSINPAFGDELMELQNSEEVPYLRDTTKDIDVDESDAIITYLQLTYGAPESTSESPAPL